MKKQSKTEALALDELETFVFEIADFRLARENFSVDREGHDVRRCFPFDFRRPQGDDNVIPRPRHEFETRRSVGGQNFTDGDYLEKQLKKFVIEEMQFSERRQRCLWAPIKSTNLKIGEFVVDRNKNVGTHEFVFIFVIFFFRRSPRQEKPPSVDIAPNCALVNHVA